MNLLNSFLMFIKLLVVSAPPECGSPEHPPLDLLVSFVLSLSFTSSSESSSFKSSMLIGLYFS